MYMHTHTYTPSGKVPGGGSVEVFLQGSFYSSGSSAPPGLHAASLYIRNISPPVPEAVQRRHIKIYISGIKAPEDVVNTVQWRGRYLRCELPLGIFCCYQVLRKLLIFHGVLRTHIQVWISKTHRALQQLTMCTHRFGLLLQIYNLREEVRDLFLLPGSILGLTSQFLRYGRDLETGQPWSDRKFSSTWERRRCVWSIDRPMKWRTQMKQKN